MSLSTFGGPFGRTLVGRRELAVPEDPGDQPGWRGPLSVLERALAELHGAAGTLSVALSSHWLRFAVVPRREELRTAAERQEYARHCLVSRYGTVAERWELRLAGSVSGPVLACAAEPDLISALREACRRAGVELRCAEPLALVAFNGHEKRLRTGRQWFVLAETGAAFVALLNGGEWQSIAVRRLRDGHPEAIASLLATEHHLLGLETPVTQVVAPAWPEDAPPGEPMPMAPHSEARSAAVEAAVA